jgi:glycosyltransferase involved in cell wall biosynthesis
MLPSSIFLSVIIPAFNEQSRLPQTLEQVFSFLSRQDYSFEVLVVENGSTDNTLRIAQEYAQKQPNLVVLQEQQRGKGGAVRRGMLAARGAYRFMCDADLSMPIEEIIRFLPPRLTDFDLAIASREAPGAIRYHEPYYRHLGGRLINAVIRLLALPGLHDTQCGFKCFRDEIAEDLFSHQTLAGWSFDVEILYIARMRNYRLVEVPIPWYYNAESKLNLIQDALRMGGDILRVRRNALQGKYDRQV